MSGIMKNFTFSRNWRQSETPHASPHTLAGISFGADVMVFASWQLHYLRHQSEILFPLHHREGAGWKGERLRGFERETVSLKQSRWLVSLDRNPVYRIMSVCHWRAPTTAFSRNGCYRYGKLMKLAEKERISWNLCSLWDIRNVIRTFSSPKNTLKQDF